MKLRNLLWGGMVCCALAVFAACEPVQNEDLGNPALTVSVSDLAFEEVGGDQAVVLNATRDWRATSSAEWLVVAPASGEASADDQTVVVSALANDGGNRTATITFTIGTVIKTVTATQAGSGVSSGGDGTAANPYTAAKATEVASELSSDGQIADVYVKGTIKSIKEISTSYGNATYALTDADGAASFQIYRGKYFGGAKFTSEDQIKVGDVVVVKGILVNYMGNTPQLTSNSEIVELNGQTGAGSDNSGTDTPVVAPTEIPSAITSLTDFLAAAVGDTWYKLKGQIINIASTVYGNLTIKDEAGKELYVYGLTKEFAASNDKSFSTIAGLSVGDIVTLVGQRGEHNGAGQAVNAFYISHEEGELDLGEPVNFTKVTSALTDWTGTYLIYMGDNKAHATISSKDLAATSDVLTDNDGVIVAPEAFAVTIAAEGDKWSIKLPDGKYLGAAHNSCASSATPVGLDIEWTAAGVKISGDATNSGVTNTYYLYYSTNNGTYIRFYVDKTGGSTESLYTLPTLYKK